MFAGTFYCKIMVSKYLLLFLLGSVVVAWAEDPILDEDTVEIGEEQPETSGRNVQEVYTNINGKNVMTSCSTRRNYPGECKPFSECYPIFKLRGDVATGRTAINYAIKNDIENRVDDELMRLYKSASGLCGDKVLQSISQALGAPVPKESYVCCPLTQNVTARRPSRPPAPSNATAYQGGNCGRILQEKKGFAENQTEAGTSDEVQGRIVNGRVAGRGEFPWAVALMLNGRQFCGGSLISPQHVLTAAHCIYFMNRNDVNRLRVQIGDFNIYSTNDGSHEVRGVSNVYYHRGFSMRSLHDDVSVLRLNNPVRYTRYIQPICLSTNTWSAENSFASVAGWGQVSERGYQSSVLRTVNVKIWRQNDCIRRYWGKTPAGITNGMLCSGGAGYDSCKGDSGGPLSLKKNSRIEQVGIVSFGIGCGTYPGVYTRVDTYLQWINKNRR